MRRSGGRASLDRAVEPGANGLIVPDQSSGEDVVPVPSQQRDERGGGVPDRPGQQRVHRDAVADLLPVYVHLHDRHAWIRIELSVGEVGPKHLQRVAILHCSVPGARPEEAGQSGVGGVVVGDVVFAAQCVDHRSLESLREGDHLVVCARKAGSEQDREVVRGVELACGVSERFDVGGDA